MRDLSTLAACKREIPFATVCLPFPIIRFLPEKQQPCATCSANYIVYFIYNTKRLKHANLYLGFYSLSLSLSFYRVRKNANLRENPQSIRYIISHKHNPFCSKLILCYLIRIINPYQLYLTLDHFISFYHITRPMKKIVKSNKTPTRR